MDEVSLSSRSERYPYDGEWDITAKTRHGELWVFKPMFLAEETSSPKIPVGFGDDVNVSRWILIHNTTEIEDLPEAIGQIPLSEWQGVDWNRIKAFADGREVTPNIRVPRTNQVKAVTAASSHYSTHSRGRMIMPCGTGKTYAGILIADALHAETIIIAAPSLALIRQNLIGWSEAFDAKDRTFDCICVCSDQTVGDVGGDEVREHSSSLGIEVSTDANVIASLLRRPRERPLVVFTTYHSSPVLAEATQKVGFKFDFALLDEAHKTVGSTDRAFATLLDDEQIFIDRRLSMTATERVYKGDKIDVLSMDNENDYGLCFYRLSFKAAIDEGLICDYKIITFFVGEAEIRNLIEGQAEIDIAIDGKKAFENANALSLAAGIALKNVIREHDVRHIISFHRSIQAAAKFSLQQDALDKVLDPMPGISNLHVSGAMSTARRTEIMKRFASSEYGLVSNARCLTEGIDVPSTDCILFEGSRQSVIDVAQAAGRAMRIYPGKECGYVVIPVVVPEDKTFEEFVETTEFRKVAQTLTAMSTQDERIVSEFRLSSPSQGNRGGTTTVKEEILIFRGNIPGGVGMEFSRFAEAVKTKVWSTLGRANRRSFEEAREFVHSLGLKNTREWKAFARSDRMPEDLPNAVDRIYAGKGWVSWGDWLGTGKVADKKKQWRSFDEARTYIHSLAINGHAEWRKFVRSDRKPADIPSRPDVAYADAGWISYGDFLGSRRRKSNSGRDEMLPDLSDESYSGIRP